ncbi:MAG: Mur ligase domain-containing protein [Nitrospirota bacterium]
MAKIFFSGVGGSGVSAIASFMADLGHIVVGSDRSFDRNPEHPICKILKAKGITIVPQDGSGIDSSFDFAVFSTAVEDDQPEVIKVRELGIAMKTRPQYLCEIVSKFRTVAVAGTGGKSSTSGMLAFLMYKLGLKPNFISGGRVKQFKTRNNPGNSLIGSSDLLIIEACESDGTIIHYHPVYSIIANLSLDHNLIEKTTEMFETFSRNTKEMVIINSDDKNLSCCHLDKSIRFSIDTDSEYQAKAIEYQQFKTIFKLNGVDFKLSLPGKYNLYNALSCIALLSEMGIRLKDIAEILPDFSGLDRRFDIHIDDGENLVIDDYAHNPHKISCLMESIQRIRHRVCYIFQPHGFGPTRLMKQGYIEAFIKNLRKEDHLILLPIYYAGGTSIKDISSEDLLNEIKAAGKSVEVLHERSLLFNRLKEWNNYVVFGARDESLAEFAQEISLRL